jgi:uncharacterized membrane protein
MSSVKLVATRFRRLGLVFMPGCRSSRLHPTVSVYLASWAGTCARATLQAASSRHARGAGIKCSGTRIVSSLTLAVVLLVGVTGATSAQPTSPSPQGSYTVSSIGPQNSEALAVNEAGQIVGQASMDGLTQAAILYPTLVGLGVLDAPHPPQTFSLATGINDSGVVVGVSYGDSGTPTPFIWSQSTGMQPLALPPYWAGAGNQISGGTPIINNNGQVAIGFCDLYNCYADLYTPGTGWQIIMSQVFFPAGNGYIQVNDLNNPGHIVGQYVINYDPNAPGGSIGTRHAFFWSPATGMIDLGTLPQQQESDGYALNDFDVIVGSAVAKNTSSTCAMSNGGHAVRWTNPKAHAYDLGNIRSGGCAFPTGINSAGQIVAYAALNNGYSSFVLSTKQSGWAQLPALPSQDPPTMVFDINNSGVAVGFSSSFATRWAP